MFDCVFPTRTAVRGWGGGAGGRLGGGVLTLTHPPPRVPPPPQRFGSALVPWGSLQLKNKQFANDFRPIDESCRCPTCQRWVLGGGGSWGGGSG